MNIRMCGLVFFGLFCSQSLLGAGGFDSGGGDALQIQGKDFPKPTLLREARDVALSSLNVSTLPEEFVEIFSDQVRKTAQRIRYIDSDFVLLNNRSCYSSHVSVGAYTENALEGKTYFFKRSLSYNAYKMAQVLLHETVHQIMVSKEILCDEAFIDLIADEVLLGEVSAETRAKIEEDLPLISARKLALQHNKAWEGAKDLRREVERALNLELQSAVDLHSEAFESFRTGLKVLEERLDFAKIDLQPFNLNELLLRGCFPFTSRQALSPTSTCLAEALFNRRYSEEELKKAALWHNKSRGVRTQHLSVTQQSDMQDIVLSLSNLSNRDRRNYGSNAPIHMNLKSHSAQRSLERFIDRFNYFAEYSDLLKYGYSRNTLRKRLQKEMALKQMSFFTPSILYYSLVRGLVD